MKIDRSKFRSLCLSMFPVVAIACGGSGGDGTGAGGSDLSGSGGAPPAGAAAAPAASGTPAAAAAAAAAVVTVNTTPVSVKSDTCIVDIKAPTVSIPSNKAAETAINAALAPLAASPCDEGGLEIESSFEVTANADGLLSILVTGSETFLAAGTHPNGTVHTFNFDVKNGGKTLAWSDVVTPDGSAKEVAACIALDPNAALGSPTDEGSFAATECKSSVATDPAFGGQPLWVARAAGLELESTTDHADGDFKASVVAWKDLIPAGLENTVVLDYAKTQK